MLYSRAKALRRRRNDLRARWRDLQHRQAAFVGAIGFEAEQAVNAGEARRISQHGGAKALGALGFHQGRNEGDGVVGERRGPGRVLLEAGTVTFGEAAITSTVGRGVPAAVERRI